MSGTNPEIYEGWLTKQGKKIKNWKRRWFVLENGEMSYFISVEAKKLGKAKGKFLIKNAECSLINIDNKPNCFQAKTLGRIYYMFPDNGEDVQVWKEKLILHGAVWINPDGTKAETTLAPETLKSNENSTNTNMNNDTNTNNTNNTNNNNQTNNQQKTDNQQTPTKPKTKSGEEEEEFDEEKVKQIESALDSTIDDLKNSFKSNKQPRTQPKKRNEEEGSFLTTLQKKLEKEI